MFLGELRVTGGGGGGVVVRLARALVGGSGGMSNY